MKKVAVLRCLQTASSCTGAGCIRAVQEKTKVFEKYGDEELKLLAIFECNGCGEYTLPNPEGMQKKINKIKELAPDVVHLSNCTRKKNESGEKVLCSTIEKIAEEFKAAGIEVAEGTH